MKSALHHSKAIAATFVIVMATPGFALRGGQDATKGTAVAYPWVFQNGNVTSKTFAVTTVEEIIGKAKYALIQQHQAEDAWRKANLPKPSFGRLPNRTTLAKYGKALHASKVLYGSVSWHTRSIWVNAGPKTISTALVNAYVYDVSTNKVSYFRIGISGRSDEKTIGYKLAADVLLTPLVTAASGGPATPREQRAVQIALSNAYHAWVFPARMSK